MFEKKNSLSVWLHNLWTMLPPRDDQPLLKYIVYRLEDSDDLSISAAKKRSLFYTAFIFITVVVIALALILINRFFFLDDIYWINTELHVLFESFCGLISIIIGMILTWEHSRSGETNVLFIVYSFFSFSILSFFMPSRIMTIIYSSGFIQWALCSGPYSFLFQCLFIIPMNPTLTS